MKTTKRLCERFAALQIEPYGGYPLSWDVKIVFCPTVEQVLAKIADSFYINSTELFTIYPEADRTVGEFLGRVNMDASVTESMWDSWCNADAYRMVNPDRLKRWGLPYGEDAPGVKGPFSADFELQGRSGGHLVVTRFDGISLRHTDLTNPDEWDCHPVWYRRMCAMAEEWNAILHPKAVYAEFVYTIAWMVNNILEGER